MSIIKNFMYYTTIIGENKFFELQFFFHRIYFSGLSIALKLFTDKNIFLFDVDLFLFNIFLSYTRRTDHAGMYIEIRILNVNFNLDLLDRRHWDGENDKWEDS